MKGTFRFNHDGEARYTPSGADMEPGEIVELPDGRAAINNSNNSIPDGVEGRVATCGIIEVVKGSALVFADGASVYIDADAIATAIGGGFLVGKARRGGAGNGETKLYVALNAPV